MLKRYAVHFTLLAVLLIYAARLLKLLNVSAPNYAYDYGFFMPRLFAGILSFRAQGFAPPYYTAFLCGGFPLYADPQSMFYSLPQFLSFIVNPWDAIQLTILILILLSGLAVFLLAGKVFALPAWAALTAAIFFSTNGFFRARMLIGHLSFHSFLLIPLLALALLYPGRAVLWPTLLFSLVLACTVHGGAHYVTIFALMSSAMLVCLYFICQGPQVRISGKTLLTRAGAGLALAAGLSISKIYAAWSLMSTHPRRFRFDYLDSLSEAGRLLYVQFVDPLAGPPLLRWGPWEYDSSLSLMIWPGVVAALCLLPGEIKFNRGRIAAVSLFLLGTYFVLGVASGTASWLPLFKQLPLINQMRLNMRFSSVLLLPLCLLSAYGYARLCGRLSKTQLVAWSVPLLTIILSLYGLQRISTLAPAFMSFDGSEVARFYSRLKTAGNVSPQRIGLPQNDDFKAMVNLEANPACYTAIWRRPPTRSLTPGPIGEPRHGYFNLINPACYWYPAENGCRPGTRIKESERENFEALMAHRNPDWEISALQRAANRLNILALAAWCAGLGWFLLLRLHKSGS